MYNINIKQAHTNMCTHIQTLKRKNRRTYIQTGAHTYKQAHIYAHRQNTNTRMLSHMLARLYVDTLTPRYTSASIDALTHTLCLYKLFVLFFL